MSDEKEDEQKVVSLEEFKNEKAIQEGLAAHERGELFYFEPFELDYDDPPNGVGMLDCEAHPICILLDKEKLSGISMSADTAERLGAELMDAAKEYRKHKSQQDKEGL